LSGRLVFTLAEISAVYMADPDLRELLTSLESINAVGESAAPMLILPGAILLEKHFNNNIDDSVLFATSETGSGYISDMLMLDWLEYWEKQTRPKARTRAKKDAPPAEWRMLIFDGHSSHMTIEFINYCWECKVIPFLLPLHTTHLLQPLDVGVFQLMKQHHQNLLAEQVRFGGMEYTKMDFLDAYQEIRNLTMKKKTILHAWEKAGL
jgi:hypothetical protein